LVILEKHQLHKFPQITQTALPLILGAWNYTSGMEKMLRLRQHIEYAAEKGGLDAVDQFLRSLSDNDWYIAGK